MDRRLRFALFALAFTMWWLAVPRAQFETPNRAFHQKTAFKLEGRHLAVACDSCHLKGEFKGTPTACIDCHWVRRQDDRFKLQLGTECVQCHSTSSWTPARFDHGAATGSPLNGAHRSLSCQSCHKNDNLRTADSACVSCHLQDYQAAREPNHLASGFPTNCEACHRAGDTSFRGAQFDHQATFALVGQHATQACAACHTNNVYRGTPRDCVGCHRTDYERTTTPNHAAAGFPTTCDSCHRPTDASFRGTGFDHASVFPLVGQHAQQTCTTCHQNNVYRGTPRDCVGCHRADYDRTTSPNHVSAGFSTTCDTCHRPTDASFRGAVFDHASVFALVGQHAQQTCTACHQNGVYRGTPTQCVGCHLADYNRTTSPNHAAAGFPTTCDSCHRATDSSFRGAVFDHNSVFPLLNRHAAQPCAACHVNNVYRGTPTQCEGCHLTDYNNTTAPNHLATGFPITCVSCHKATDSSWTQGVFTHLFPITSGKHRFPCASCHTTPNYQVFTCLTCHRQPEMDDKHRGFNGYRYDSLACYACHPTGRKELPANAPDAGAAGLAHMRLVSSHTPLPAARPPVVAHLSARRRP